MGHGKESESLRAELKRVLRILIPLDVGLADSRHTIKRPRDKRRPKLMILSPSRTQALAALSYGLMCDLAVVEAAESVECCRQRWAAHEVEAVIDGKRTSRCVPGLRSVADYTTSTVSGPTDRD